MEEKRDYFIQLSFWDKVNIILYQYLWHPLNHELVAFALLSMIFVFTYGYIVNSFNFLTMILGSLSILLLVLLKSYFSFRKLNKSQEIKINRKRTKLLLYNNVMSIDQIKILLLGSDSSVYFWYNNRDYFKKSFLMYFHYKFNNGTRFVSFNKKMYKQVYNALKLFNLPILPNLFDDNLYDQTKIEPKSISKEEIPIVINSVDKFRLYLLKSLQQGRIYLYQLSDIFFPFIIRSAIIIMILVFIYKSFFFYLIMVFFGILAYPAPYLFVDLMSYRSNEYGLKFIFLNMGLLKDFLQKSKGETVNLFDYEPIFDFDISSVKLIGLEE